MAKPTFTALWKRIQAEAEAEGPAVVAELHRLQHRYRLGGQLSMLRHRRGLTQGDLAARTGIDQADISRIERGAINATADTLARLAAAVGAELSLVSAREADRV